MRIHDIGQGLLLSLVRLSGIKDQIRKECGEILCQCRMIEFQVDNRLAQQREDPLRNRRAGLTGRWCGKHTHPFSPSRSPCRAQPR